MREIARIDRICEVLAEKWKLVPDQRLGQFLQNYIFGHGDIFFLDDDATEIRLREIKRGGEDEGI